jgi:hypothetical protein
MPMLVGFKIRSDIETVVEKKFSPIYKILLLKVMNALDTEAHMETCAMHYKDYRFWVNR